MHDGVLNFMEVMLALAITGGGIYLMSILLNAFQHRLTGGRTPVAEQLEELTLRLEELERVVADGPTVEADGRLIDMEERLEFAERLLAAEDRAQLPEPADEVTATGERGGHRG